MCSSDLVARMEAIRMFLAFACYQNFKVYQMDVKSAFLNGDLEEDVGKNTERGGESVFSENNKTLLFLS